MNSYQDKAWEVIEKDLALKGRTIVSGQCFAKIFMVKTKDANGKRKTIEYSGANNVLPGYIDLKPLMDAAA